MTHAGGWGSREWRTDEGYSRGWGQREREGGTRRRRNIQRDKVISEFSFVFQLNYSYTLK